MRSSVNSRLGPLTLRHGAISDRGNLQVVGPQPQAASPLATRLELLRNTLRPTPHVPFRRPPCPTGVRAEPRDDTGGSLKTRLQKVKELCATIPNAYWTNQYGNLDAVEAHYELTATEICADFDSLDYVFIGVGTAGTIAGVSRRLKEHYPNIRVIAVDTEGSAIFGGAPRKRHIPGIGSSVVPQLLSHAKIDDVVVISERETVQACRELLTTHGLFVGGSSGTAFAAIKRYAARMPAYTHPTVLFLCADRGTPYLDTVFDPTWTTRLE